MSNVLSRKCRALRWLTSYVGRGKKPHVTRHLFWFRSQRNIYCLPPGLCQMSAHSLPLTLSCVCSQRRIQPLNHACSGLQCVCVDRQREKEREREREREREWERERERERHTAVYATEDLVLVNVSQREGAGYRCLILRHILRQCIIRLVVQCNSSWIPCSLVMDSRKTIFFVADQKRGVWGRGAKVHWIYVCAYVLSWCGERLRRRCVRILSRQAFLQLCDGFIQQSLWSSCIGHLKSKGLINLDSLQLLMLPHGHNIVFLGTAFPFCQLQPASYLTISST